MGPLPGVVAGLLVLATGCGALGENGGNAGAAADGEVATELSGLALLHRGYGGGDPEQDQALVFHDPETGGETAAVELPEGAVDPMAPELPAHSLFSADWHYFAHASPDSGAMELAALAEDGSAYEAAATLEPPEDQTWGDPRISGDRLWFTAESTGEGQEGTRVLSVALDETEGTPNQEGALPLDANGQPSDWAVDPDDELYIREQQQTTQVGGGNGDLVVRESGDNVMNATLTTNGEQWQDLGASPAWGGDSIVVGPVDANGEVAEERAGAHLVALDENRQGFESTELLGGGDAPVLQHAPAPNRDALLLQSTSAWHRVDIGDDGGAGQAEELFPSPRDTSMAGYPLVVRWSEPEG
ncbi:hypothetical protein [Lipingzhangella halophila]